MKKNRLLFISRRWFSGRKGSSGSLRTGLAVAGLAMGVAALIVVMGVMNGLQGGYIDSILEISSFHIRVVLPQATGGDRGTGAAESALAAVRAVPGVRSVLPFRETHVMALGPSGRELALSLALLPDDAAARDPGLADALGLQGTASLSPDDGILLGAEAAAALGAWPGSTLRLLGFSSSEEEGLGATSAELSLAGTFKSGYWEFDVGKAYLGQGSMSAGTLMPSGAPTVLGIKLDNRYADRQALARIAALPMIPEGAATSWREYNRSFFGALRTEKIVMLLLVGLIFAVVGVNIAYAMKRAVAVRMQDLAVLRAVGLEAGAIRDIFLVEGFTVGASGAAIGTAAGLLVAANVNPILAAAQRLAAVFSAGSFPGGITASFYLDRVPVRIQTAETAFIALAAVAAAAFAAGSAASRAVMPSPAEVLRNE